MTSLQRFESVFNGRSITEMPVALCYEALVMRDHFDELSDVPWPYFTDSDIEKRMRWHEGVKKRLSHDWVKFPFPFCVEDGTKPQPKPVWNGQDFAEEWLDIQKKDSAGSREVIDRFIAMPEDQNKAGEGPLTDRLKGLYSDRPLIAHVTTPFWECSYLWKFEELMALTLDSPELLMYAEERLMLRTIKKLERMKEKGVQFIWIEECYTDMLSPGAFARFGIEYAKEIVNAIRKLGMKSVYYFTGAPEGKLDALLSMRADAYAFEESKKGFDTNIAALAKKIKGEFVLVGNIDTIGILQDSDMDAIRQEIKRQVEAGKINGGRFVIGVGSPITPLTPMDKIIEFLEITREEAAL